MLKKLLFAASISITISANAQVLSGLVSKYSFNSGTANDEIASNHLSAQNGAAFGIDRFGNVNKSAFLDGIDDYFKTTNPFFLQGNPFTISIWYKSNDGAQYRQTFFNTFPHEQISVGYNWHNNGSYDIAINDGITWNICSNTAVGLDTFFVNSSVVVTNWNHFVMSYDGVTWKSYINNVIVNSCNTGTPSSVMSDLYFGAISNGPQSYFNGNLDDIRIYNRAITFSEVTTLYNEPDPMTVGVNENNLDRSNVSVFPNPNNGAFTIKSAKNELITITNELGQVIKSIDLNKQNDFSFEIINLKPGIYFLIGESTKHKIVVTQ
jgi:hypothetical protein